MAWEVSGIGVIEIIENESTYGVLSEILISNKVGLAHIRLVGELIVAQADLNEPAMEGESLSLSDLASISERVADSEDIYKELWREINSPNDQPIDPRGLRRLEMVLRNTVSTFRELGEEIRANSARS